LDLPGAPDFPSIPSAPTDVYSGAPTQPEAPTIYGNQPGPKTITPGFFSGGSVPDEAKPGYRHNTRAGDVTNVLRPYQPQQVYGYG